eukprot:TRINITY_DN68886_c0_g1_i1.p1 TRINITY_DN68886_c0_g1~~TRINITY_DN68886_c0_g1_i1.p1  ORF type:complete len:422 (-),score=78.11 TRINITY_DN68886_c0_g1_i1:43-1308(-)
MAAGGVSIARGPLRFAGRAAWPALDAGLKIFERQLSERSGDALLEQICARAAATQNSALPEPVVSANGLAVRVSAGEACDALCHALLCNGRDAVAEAPRPQTAPKPANRCAGDGNGGGLVFDEWMRSTSLLAAEKAACFLHYLHNATSDGFDSSRLIYFELRAAQTDDIEPSSASVAWPAVRVHVGEFTEREQDDTFVNFANHVFLYGKLTPSDSGVTVEEFLQVEYPELCIGLLYFGTMRENEAVVTEGVRKFSTHSGYMNTFACAGPCDDARIFRVLSLDAKNFSSSSAEDKTITYADQFERANVVRDVRKACLAFDGCQLVSTGKWGCGVFKGNVYLKFLQQILASSLCKVQELSFTTYRQQFEADACCKISAALTAGAITPQDLFAFLVSLPANLGVGDNDEVFLDAAMCWLESKSC